MSGPTSLAGRHVLIAGFGRAGAAAARAGLVAGARVTVYDDDPQVLADRVAARMGDSVATITDAGQAFAGQPPDVLVASPGLPPTTPLLLAAQRAGVPVWSEPELAWRLLSGRTRLLAVTGTNGKTTTTELLAACLSAPAAGNIGQPLSALVEAPPPLVVAELSSFQLHYIHTLRADVAVVVNVADDHLDWHGDAAAYAAAKARIFERQRSAGAPGLGGRDWAVTNADDPGAVRLTQAYPPRAGRATFTLGPPARNAVGILDGVLVERCTTDQPTPVVAVNALGVRGAHNVANAAAATAAALAAGVAPAALARPLSAARVGAHRLEVVAERQSVRWINDSKATNPHAAAAALRSFDSVVWIAGGLNKGLSFAPLGNVIADRVRLALTIGSAGPELAALTRASGIETVEAGDLDTAVAVARTRAQPGDVVLLAPACASMDQFADYAERGDRFRALVTASEPGGPSPAMEPGAAELRA